LLKKLKIFLQAFDMNTQNLAKSARINVVNMVNQGNSSHIGSILSIVDILAVLYGEVMNYDVKDSNLQLRDRFILSKGHAGAGVYAILAEVGFFNKAELLNHCQNGSKFSGHVSHKDVPGVEFSTGSLGHGLPVGAGMALRAKLDDLNYKVFIVLGDGELDEGSNWEALMFAAHKKLNNLCIIVDRNNLQSMDTTENTLALEPLTKKIQAFGWRVEEIDGHDHIALKRSFNTSTSTPLCVIANTIKGKGVSYMENSIEWHYKTPKGNQFKQAIIELEAL
jgi:transketolase